MHNSIVPRSPCSEGMTNLPSLQPCPIRHSRPSLPELLQWLPTQVWGGRIPRAPGFGCKQAQNLARGSLRRGLVQLIPQHAAYRHIEYGDQQQAQEGRKQHAADHAGSDLMS
jgi:hypothetical protein